MVVEVALQWCSDSFSDMLVSFVNSVKTIDGGTHIDGLKVQINPSPWSCCCLCMKPKQVLWIRKGSSQGGNM